MLSRLVLYSPNLSSSLNRVGTRGMRTRHNSRELCVRRLVTAVRANQVDSHPPQSRTGSPLRTYFLLCWLWLLSSRRHPISPSQSLQMPACSWRTMKTWTKTQRPRFFGLLPGCRQQCLPLASTCRSSWLLRSYTPLENLGKLGRLHEIESTPIHFCVHRASRYVLTVRAVISGRSKKHGTSLSIRGHIEKLECRT